VEAGEVFNRKTLHINKKPGGGNLTGQTQEVSR
jgi:hypothetical protein